ncbi:MAG: class I SAM-dependent methyltransferase [Anaerolineae bacterium]|nr:class I SAM-dependent methyltransferase [Anaerolineae bacterium]
MHNTYDEVPYPNLSHSNTHPDHLATIATLLGVDAPPVDCCRVLELGCAGGANLLPMAYGLPESEFLGIDASSRQISDGRDTVKQLGLHNLCLRSMDILDVSDALGQFDYIIAHGVYSWVPSSVQDKILQICNHNLTPHGVAYISYNTYPGWHLMSIIRDAMRYRTHNIFDPQQRAAVARSTLEFLAKSVPVERPHGAFVQSYATFLSDQAKRIDAESDAFLLHDELEDINQPVYFHEFAKRAADNGMQYLAEADFQSVFTDNLGSETAQYLEDGASDIVELEQMTDFVRNRMFRRTLLCHDDIPITRILDTRNALNLYVASRAVPVAAQPNTLTRSVEEFRGPDGATLSIDHPISKAAMIHLSDISPSAIGIPELCAAACRRLDADGQHSPNPDDSDILMANLLKAFSYSSQLAEFHVHVPAMLQPAIDRQPIASPVARHHALESDVVTNLWHERVRVDSLRRYVLCRLDGSHTWDDLLDDLIGQAQSGQLEVKRDGSPISDPEEVKAILSRNIVSVLNWAARSALLTQPPAERA